MSTAGVVILIFACGLFALLGVLGAKSEKHERHELARKGHLVSATIVSVQESDGIWVKYEFKLPDGKTTQTGSDVLPYGTKIKAGDKIIVRYNPMLPAVSKYVERG
jgi:hypothetical protein